MSGKNWFLASLVAISGLFLFHLSTLAGEVPGSAMPTFSLIEVTTTLSDVDPSNPWKIDAMRKTSRVGVYIDQDHVLVGGVDPRYILSFFLKERRIETEFNASTGAVDSELKLALVKMNRVQDRIPVDMKPAPLLDSLTGLRKRDRLAVIHMPASGDYREHTVFFENYVAEKSPAGNTRIPLYSFSAYARGEIAPGDPIFREGTLAGFVVEYDAKTGLGTSLPVELIHQFLERHVDQGQDGAILQIQEGTGNKRSDTIVVDPGFRSELLKPAVVRMESGLRSSTGAVILSDVLEKGGAEGVLFPEDIIIGVDGRSVGADGTMEDPVYGRLPVETAILLEDGRFASSGTLRSLRIVRGGEIRSLQIRLHPFEYGDYRLPPGNPAQPYTIVGGFLFTELTSDLIGRDPGATARYRYLSKERKFRDSHVADRFVVLQRTLPIPTNRGYHFERLLVTGINGIVVRNLTHMTELIKEASDADLPIRINLEGNRILILDPGRLSEADQEVIMRHGIRYLRDNL